MTRLLVLGLLAGLGLGAAAVVLLEAVLRKELDAARRAWTYQANSTNVRG